MGNARPRIFAAVVACAAFALSFGTTTVDARSVGMEAGGTTVLGDRWTDPEWGISIAPPAGWRRSPSESLNPLTQPADPVFEIARFQRRLGDRSLYAQPIAMTSGLLNDAGAMISIAVARAGSALVGADPQRWEETSRGLKGFVATDEESSAEGMRSFTRYFFARATGRVVVVRLLADEDEWSAVRVRLFSSLATLTADPSKANGPEAVASPPPSPKPSVTEDVVDPSLAIRGQILARAASMLNVPYAWGGNSTKSGMDCSSWLSRVWGVERYSTDTMWKVSFPISKAELLPADALNLTTGRDPKHAGHIRLFEAWANTAHTAMWVYEETEPRSVHRVVAYDDRFQPIRLSGLSGDGVALIIPGTPAERTATPRTPKPTVKPTPRPTPKPTPRLTPKPTVSGGTSPRPTPTQTPGTR